jgi:hypothetical protein
VKLIALGYRARQGKDAACDAMVKARAFTGVRKFGFADAVKREVQAWFEAWGGVDGAFRAWDAGKVAALPKRPKWVVRDADPPMDDPLCPLGKYRSLLQFWGTEYRRAKDCDYWITTLARELDRVHPPWAVIGDMRFPNEFAWVKAVEGTTVKVERPRVWSSIPSTHLSECALDDFTFDYTISNHGTLADLQNSAVMLFDAIRHRDCQRRLWQQIDKEPW